jgi:alpha-tubulin suppressor-like RCC1 family protein
MTMSATRSFKLAAWVMLAVFSAIPAFAATWTVTSLADSGAGSLRAAITSAASGDTINFSLTYPATITLASTLTISQNLTISGPGASSLAISGNNSVEVFSIAGGISVTISGVTIQGGSSTPSFYGGGIYNGGTLTVSDSTLSGNFASYQGGGIYNNGTLTVSNSSLSGNAAPFGYGGAIHNVGTLTVSDSTLSGNSASYGGGIDNESGRLTLTNSTLSGNSASYYGGGFANEGTLTVTLSDITLSGNSAGYGGGIDNESGTLTLTNSTLSGNSANYYGGGIYNDYDGTLTLTNSTLSGNSATYHGGGIINYGTLMLSNGTLSGNSAPNPYGGGISNWNGTLTAKNSIVANSPSGGNCYIYGGTITSQGYNLSDDATCSSSFNQTGDLNSTPAGLENVLQNNGGPTRTIALFSTSPAVDAIPVSPTNYCTDTSGNPVTTDQRGVARPQGPACDMGAFELIQTLQGEAWGDNSNGQLGNGTTTNSDTPVPVNTLSGLTAIAGGEDHSLALRNDGTVRAWGYNDYGQLGNGTTTSSDTPVQVVGPGGSGVLANAVAIAGGEYHSLALRSDGTVWAWGFGADGELGNGMTTYSDTPVQVAGTGGSGYLTGVVAIAGGWQHSLALKSDGTVWAWGDNYNGQLGNGTTTSSDTPVQVVGPGGSGTLTNVVAIAGGGYYSLALKNDGTVWAWGYNGVGQLGNGTTAESDTPVQVVGPGGSGALTNVVAIAGGGYYSLALKSDGTVWAWGSNEFGDLGNGSTTNTDAPVQVLGLGGSGFLTGVVAIAGEEYDSLALRSNGTVWAWGYNALGGLGNGTTTNSDTPVEVVGTGGSGFLTGVVAIAGGGLHSVALAPPTKLGQTISFTQAAPASASYNSTFPVAAQSTSGLSVRLSVDAGSTGVCSLGTPSVSSGVTSATVTMLSGTGTCTIDANQSGDGSYDAAAQQQTSAAAQTISQATLTVTGPASVTYGTTGTATATGGSGTGLVSFSAGASTGCSVSGTTVSVSNASGTCSLTATKAADNNYSAASSAAFAVTLVPLGQTISFTQAAPGSASYYSVFTVGAESTSGLTVTLSVDSSSTSVCSLGTPSVASGVTSATVAMLSATGTCTIDANQAGGGDYSAAGQQQTSAAAATIGTTLTVTNTNDSGFGSLRDAIANAASGDTINFSLPYPATITLASTLSISTSVTISGPGASNVAMSGNNAVEVFSIGGGITVNISGVTIENGSNSGGGTYGSVAGGGISNGGTLTLSNSTISGNTVSADGSGFYVSVYGGGIYNGGTLTLSDSTISGNTATGAGNDYYGSVYGSGIYNAGTLTLSNSTISGNTASGGGNDYFGSVGGGGVSNGGTLTLSNSTIAGNSANNANGRVGASGGGISNGGTLIAKNSIVANNPSGGNCSGTFTSQGYNLSDDASCAASFTQTGDLNSTAAGLDPSGLKANGGPTQTIALLAGSLAVDAIPLSPINYCTDTNGNAVTTDQRGVTRPQGAACDIGAFELTQAQAGQTSQTISFTTTAPTNASYNSTFPVAAQSTSGLTVTLSVDSSSTSVCSLGTPSVSGGVTSATVTMLSGTGTCTIFAIQSGNASYSSATLQQTSAIAVPAGQATLTVTGPASVTYGTTGTATATGGSGTGALSFSAGASTGCSVSGTTVSVSDASGTCSLTATKAADNNYSAATSAAFAVTLQKAAATVTLGSLTQTYNGSPESATATTSPVSGLTVNFTYNGSAAAPTSVGSYAVVGTISDNNYQGSASGTFTITAATLTYTANTASRTYGAANPAFSGTVTGFVGSDNQANATTGTLTFTSAATSGSSVGSYAINGSGLTANNGNYTFVQAAGNATALTITAATLTYTANTASRSYGAANPAFSGTVTGFVGSDNQANATTGTLTFTSAATSGSSVGSYAINGSGLTANNGNYIFVQAAGNATALTITAATLTYTANTASRTYGTANPAFSGTVTGFVNGDTQASATTGTLTFTSAATSGSSVGNYAINGSGLTANNGNYTFVQAAGNATALTITAATLTYTANTASRSYGAANPAFSGTVTGFVGSDNQANATTGTLTFTSAATSGSSVGSYAINGSGLTANNGNYIFVQAAGNATALTITRAALLITASSATMSRGGTMPTITPLYSGLVNGDTATVPTPPNCSAPGVTSSSGAGTYTTSCSGAVDPNYKISYATGTLTITASNARVSPASLSFRHQALDTSSTSREVTLASTGTTDLNISSITITGSNPSDFARTSHCPASLAPGHACTIDVQFTPSQTGALTAAVTITDNALSSPQTVTLSGTGIVQADLSPTDVTFRAQRVGTTSAPEVVTLTNNLLTHLAIASITFTGADPGDFSETDTCGRHLMAESQCWIFVTFRPRAKGTRTATLNVNDSANNSPQTVALTGTGE